MFVFSKLHLHHEARGLSSQLHPVIFTQASPDTQKPSLRAATVFLEMPKADGASARRLSSSAFFAVGARNRDFSHFDDDDEDDFGFTDSA